MSRRAIGKEKEDAVVTRVERMSERSEGRCNGILLIDVFMASEGEWVLLVKIPRNRNMRPGRLSQPNDSQRYSQSPWIRDHGRVVDLAQGAGGHNDSKETESGHGHE